jgi:tetratricopeptide (TPR) repeat protein
MIEVCRQYYRGHTKQLKLIDEFERDYRPEDAIRWYTKQSFVYKLVNKALRSEDIDQLHTFRFFIGDLSESLAREHEKILSSEEEILTVYRGVKLDREEFDQLKENQGKLISTNGYLSTSRLRSPALAFAKKPSKRTNVIPVLFEIECAVKELGKTVIFADIAMFSDFPNEQEVLFDLSAAFKLESIERVEGIELIKMSATKDGDTITKHYIEETHRETEEKSVGIVFGRLMCNLGEYDKSLKYFEQLLKDPNGEDVAWIEFNIGRALRLKGEWDAALVYYDRVYDRMIKAEPTRVKDSANVLNDIGIILKNQGKCDEALNYYEQALKIREKYYPTDHIDISTSLISIGNILYSQAKYAGALDYYERALKIQEKYYPSSYLEFASSLNNIGAILYNQAKYDEARDYYRRTLEIQEKYYPSNHVDIATTLNNIGAILYSKGKYNEAREYYQRALRIQEKYFPSGHVNIGCSLRNIGLCYESQNKSKVAVDYFQRAFTIYEKLLPVGHPNRVVIEGDIFRVTGKRILIK